MSEEKKYFFQNEKMKKFARKVFNKRTFIGALIAIVLVVALRIAFSLVFEIEGTVTKVDGSNITIANFLSTKTVDVGSFQTTANNIQVGDRVEVMKNLSGDVISVRDNFGKHMNGRGKGDFGGKPGPMGNGGQRGMKRR